MCSFVVAIVYWLYVSAEYFPGPEFGLELPRWYVRSVCVFWDSYITIHHTHTTQTHRTHQFRFHNNSTIHNNSSTVHTVLRISRSMWAVITTIYTTHIMHIHIYTQYNTFISCVFHRHRTGYIIVVALLLVLCLFTFCASLCLRFVYRF